jgi:hypothetical protein
MSVRSWLFSVALAFAFLILASLAFLDRPALANPTSPSSSAPKTAHVAHSGILDIVTADPSNLAELHSLLARHSSGSAKQPATDAHDPTCWQVVASPNAQPDYNTLQAVSAVSPNDIWAVGSYCCTPSGVQQNLIEHWNGSAWSIAPSPNVGEFDNILSGVVALSPNNAWAVGFFFDGDRLETLTIHWNGVSWTVVPSPNPGQRNNYLIAIDAISPNDIWATGNYRTYAGGPFVSLTEHWNGNAWTVVPNPNPGLARDQLVSVVALSRNNVWAVGNACDTGDCFASVGRTLVEHWNGTSWQVVPSPNAGAGFNDLSAVDASSPNDIWADGSYCEDVDCNVSKPLIEHWDGSAWSISPTSFPDSAGSTYWGIVALSRNDVWAGGSYSTDNTTWTNLLSHWDGTSWTNIPVTSPGGDDNDLRALTAMGKKNVWAVGDYDDGLGERTQVQHYDGKCR